VVSNSTLDHFSDVRQIAAGLRELGRVLRDGGPLLLTLDNPVNPLLAFRRLVPLNLLQKVGLVPYFVGATLGPSRLKRCCVEAGFQVRRMGAVLHCPRVLAVVASRVVQRWASPRTRRRFLAILQSFERLQTWPTKYLTGYYVTVSAVRSPRASRATPAPASDSGSNW
jgi:SAM-dependent methyltransferase